MNIDLSAEFVAALRSTSGRDALREALAPVMAAEIKKALAEQQEKLETLGQILGIKNQAASKRLVRDPELRALGVAISPTRPMKFKRSTVLAYFAAKAAR